MLAYNPNILKEKKDMFLSIAEQMKSDVTETGINKKIAQYETYYNEINRLRKKINIDKTTIKSIFDNHHIMLNEDIYELDAKQISEIYEDNRKYNLEKYILDNLDKLVSRIKNAEYIIYEAIDKMNAIQISDNMEMDTLDERYIDLDKLRDKRNITEEDMKGKEVSYKYDELPDYIVYSFDGNKSIKDLAGEVYDDPSKWGHIITYQDNTEVIKKTLDINKIDIDSLNDPLYLKGVTIKIPKEIVSYTDDSPTQVLKVIDL